MRVRNTRRHLTACVTGALLVATAIMAAPDAHAQTSAPSAQPQAAPPIRFGGRERPSSSENKRAEQDAKPQLEFEFSAGLASDYIYRGVTLSDRKPSVDAAIEATYGRLYAGVAVASVKLPTQPAAEISLSAGIRPKLGMFEFDLGATYFSYPGENPALAFKGIDYWEAAGTAGTSLGPSVRAGVKFAYSPNVSNTGAWSRYVAAGVAYDVPANLLPPDLGISFTTAAGYSWFGNQSADFGGFALPAYLNWQAGVTVTRKMLSLDLRYYDTNLSKENCFVFTGDPNAQSGGRPDPITNPDGMTSRWCGAAFVAKLSFTR